MNKLTHKDFYRSRQKIEKINRQIEDLLVKRFILTNEIGKYKIQEGLPIEDRGRENELMESLGSSLYSDYIREIEKKIFEQSKLQQSRLKFPSVILYGMPGCGKSAFGREIAKELGVPFTDTDSAIMHAENMSINEIFEKKGEQYFRNRENRIVRCLTRGYIISVGGGTLMNEKNREYLKSLGKMVYIRRDNEELKRVSRKNRPLVNSDEDIEKLYRERVSVFEETADYVIENNGSFEKIRNKIRSYIIKNMK
ncbi:MAG: chorismate mutase [Armatimonadetes bacterium]|nr:chorismate mutase [Candidatus Hippobium faecium]